jgi:glycine dehydrogenase subunit 2
MTPRPVHQARWLEPLVVALGRAGQRGLVPPAVEPGIAAPAALAAIPAALRRATAPALPEIAQPDVLRHFLRLSQETLGGAIGGDIGQGTTTLKYNPPVNEAIVRAAGLVDAHPLAEAAAIQGTLEIVHRFEAMLREISGFERFSFQPGGGTHGIYANARIIHAYHASRGDDARDEILTTVFSHPSDAAAPATAGFKVLTVHPGERGYVEPEAVRAMVSERTAGLMIANPEDTGIFNPRIDEIVAIVHEAGGLCAHDWANANGVLGVYRAADAGFDLCQFNLHKTFGSPHSSGGFACGAIGTTAELAPYLPAPLVVRDGDAYAIEDAGPLSIDRVRAFHGVVGTVVRAYAWVRALGPDGLRAVAEAAVLNSNYLTMRLAALGVVEPSYVEANPQPRLEQVRYSLQALMEETGVGTEDVARRSGDFGVAGYFPSHHPWVVPEPATLEPTESASKDDLDAYAEIIAEIVAEARRDPERVRAAPERGPIHRVDEASLNDPERWALTWRAHVRRRREPVT